AERPLNRRQWLSIAGLGFLGYYFSAIVNFNGLKYVSVGLERMILYTYPSLVVLGSVVFLKKKLSPGIGVAMAVAYLGIAIAFQGEASGGSSSTRTFLGSSLIFLSALTYAGFVVLSGELLHTLGALRFTANVLVCSVFFVVLHFVAIHPLSTLADLEPPIWKDGAILALFGTVLPAFLLGIGLKRAGAQRFAIISTIGPVGTIALAWWVLGERMNNAQIIGLVLTLIGGLGVSLKK
ncbi:MAG: DMT family transporter, partial [Verrucomicrobiota bacterium]